MPRTNQMRVQFQDSQKGKTVNTFAAAVTPKPGNDAVTKKDIEDKLREMLRQMGRAADAKWIVGPLQQQFKVAASQVLQQVKQVKGGYDKARGIVAKKEFASPREHGVKYRVEVENMIGFNLKE